MNTSEQPRKQEPREGRKVPIIHSWSIATLEQRIKWTVRAAEQTGVALEQLRQGDLDTFIEGAPDQREQAARRRLVEPHELGLEAHMQAIVRIGETVQTMQEEQGPFIQTRLRAYVEEWQRRMQEKDATTAAIEKIDRDYVATGRLSPAYIEQLRREAVAYYPTRDITEIVAFPGSTEQQGGKAEEDVPAPEPERKRKTLLPVPESRLTSLSIFASETRFTPEGNLAMTDAEVTALLMGEGIGKTRIPGKLAQPLGFIEGYKGVLMPMNNRQTQLALSGALRILGEKVDSQQLLPEEARVVKLLQDATARENEADAIEEAKRRVMVLFEASKKKPQ